MSSTVRSLKGLITKRNDAAVNWLQDSIQAPMDIQLKESARRIKTCDGYIELLEASLTKLTKAFDETPETTEEEEDHLDKYIEKTHATIMKLHEHRRHLEETQEGNTGIDTDGVTSQAVVNKLPTIPIPTFTGRKWEWDNFWALYKANIHDQNLSQLQKFNYLLKSLSGEAKQSVSRFFISANNYEKAIQHLVKRYGNKDGIVLELNKSLHNCMAKGPSTTEQRQLWDKLSTIAAQLEEHEQHLNNQLTVQIFIQKFHVRIRKAAMEKRIRHQEEHGSEWTLNQWLDAIDKVISQEEQLNHMLSVEGQFRSYSLHSGTTVRAYPKETKATWKAEVSCECCKTRGHRWTNCPKIPKAIQKRRFLIETNRCLNCGSSSHRIASCPSGNCRNCHKKHHTSICTDGKMMEPEHRGKLPPGSQKYIERKPFKNEIKVAGKPGLGHSSKQHTVSKRIVEYRVPNHPTVDDESGKEDTSETPLVLQLKKKNEQKQNKVILLTGAVRIISAEGDSREVAVLLDTGSELSFIEDQLATELKLPIVGTTMLELNTFGSPLSQRKSCAITYLTLMDREGTEHKVRLYRNDYITCGIQQASLDRDDLEFIQKGNFHLSLPIKEGEIKPQILLGCDYLWNFIEPGDKLNLPSGLQLINSKLGYIISGQQRQQSQRPTITCTFQGHETERETWERYWSLESSGTEEYTGPQQTELQKVNEKVLKDFKESIEKREDGYYVRLPWKEDQPQLPDNWTLALKRLKKVLETYQRDTDILRAYDKVFKDQLETGVIEEVNSDEAEGHIIHYLPHQAVITPARETTKIRIVFDASAHYKDSPCLNDVLHQGPLILPDLVGIILRFRLHNIAVISDIEKAFLQVRLQERDRDATRCIWVKNITQPPTPDNLVIYRFTRLPLGSTHLRSY